MAITRTNMIDDDGSGTTGTIINAAWKTEFYNQIDAAIASGAGGALVDTPFSAGDYSARSPLVWTVTSATTNTYVRQGNLLTWAVSVTGNTSGTPDALLYVKLPAGMTSARTMFSSVAHLAAGAVIKPAEAYVTGTDILTVQFMDSTAVAVGVSVGLYFTVQLFVL